MAFRGKTWLFGENTAFREENRGLRRESWLFDGNTRFSGETWLLARTQLFWGNTRSLGKCLFWGETWILGEETWHSGEEILLSAGTLGFLGWK